MPRHPLYEDRLLAHAKNPQNYGFLPNPTVTAEAANPVCGDRIFLQLIIENTTISDIKFEGEGCAISQASASVMTTRTKGATIADALKLMHQLRTAVLVDEHKFNQDLQEFDIFKVVQKFPIRKKCVLLTWDALREACNELGK